MSLFNRIFGGGDAPVYPTDELNINGKSLKLSRQILFADLDAFDLDANFTPDVRLADGVVSLTNGDDDGVYYGLSWSIVTRKKNSGYIHSTCKFTVGTSGIKFNSDTALPTYPVGEEQFLNGGEL